LELSIGFDKSSVREMRLFRKTAWQHPIGRVVNISHAVCLRIGGSPGIRLFQSNTDLIDYLLKVAKTVLTTNENLIALHELDELDHLSGEQTIFFTTQVHHIRPWQQRSGRV
jgi:hypothetical protein